MAGLNDTFLIDDTREPEPEKVHLDVLNNNVEPGEIAELRDDVDLIAAPITEMQAAVEALTIQLRDLDLLRDSIDAQGGMSLSIAQESMHCLPGFVGEDRPLAYFTERPSKTQLKSALEAIQTESKAVMQKLLEAVKAFFRTVGEKLRTVLEWLASKLPQAEAKAQETGAKISDLQEEKITPQEKKQAQDALKEAAAKKPQVDEALLKKILAEVMYQYTKPKIDLLHELRERVGGTSFVSMVALAAKGGLEIFQERVALAVEWTEIMDRNFNQAVDQSAEFLARCDKIESQWSEHVALSGEQGEDLDYHAFIQAMLGMKALAGNVEKVNSRWETNSKELQQGAEETRAEGKPAYEQIYRGILQIYQRIARVCFDVPANMHAILRVAQAVDKLHAERDATIRKEILEQAQAALAKEIGDEQQAMDLLPAMKRILMEALNALNVHNR